ncbi:MAG TPA: glucosyl-3-phosphoglycerate synthase [Oceanobacillus sp.]|nr:glucosyl-3-phosphoglycerate synthase [Oceanobacillus sp.]
MSDYDLVLALSNNEELEGWIAFAERLLPNGGTIHLRGMVTMEPGRSLSEGALQARAWRETLTQVALDHPRIHDTASVYVDYQPLQSVFDDITRLSADLLLIQWQMNETQVGGVSIETIFENAPCDVVLVSDKVSHQKGDVLLSLRGGPNISLGVRVAQALAKDGSITLFHAADNRRIAPDLELIMRAVPQISRTVTAITDIADGIVQETEGHKLVIMGASFNKPDPVSSSVKPMFRQVHDRTGLPVALVRGAQQEAFEFHLPKTQPSVEKSLSERVDRWFAENTYHSSEFSNLQTLLAMKERQGVTISIALPALNEEKTVGKVIETLKTALMDDLPLVDEIVLIDSASTDNTVAIAESYGIPVYRHPDILRDEVGSYTGKGEALWKSLYVTKGDIIAWVDTDITNIHPRFIYGLLGPLLKNPQVQYVKGFYARPIQVGDKIQAYGGGRVTELTARPLLNLFYPELSGIVQPLSGEYAGRRTALEQVPFFSGYGVETGLLIDLLERCGLDCIAQSDLEVRVHHNQPLVDLSKMSFAILQVFVARIERAYGVQLLDRANRTMKLIVQEPGRFALDIAEIGDVERPPMATLPAYREKFGLDNYKVEVE